MNCLKAGKISCDYREVKPMDRQRGFTLVELLVVITIIGILIAIAVPSVSRVRERAKETQVQMGINDVVRALELFAQNNGGNYPGVAMPICDDDGIEPFYDNSGTIELWAMRGVIGGGDVKHDPAVTGFFNGFYFPPQPPSVVLGQEQIPDRLVASGTLERYSDNPFRTNVRGIGSRGIPMINIWGIEFEHDFTAGTDPLDFHISYPFFYENGDIAGNYDFPSAFDYSAPADFDPYYLGDFRGVLWDVNLDGLVNEGELQKYFPEGDFAYIPLDPVQRDPYNPQYMRFCQNYWIIGYGAKRTALKNKYRDVNPQFPRPLGDGDPNFSNEFELCVKNALIGAAFVVGTNYTDQFNVAGND